MSEAFKSHRDLVEWIANDPDVQAKVQADLAKDPRAVEGMRLYAEAAAELLPQLQALIPEFEQLGFQMESVDDLLGRQVVIFDADGEVAERRKINYKAALPLLAEWLPKATYPPLAWGISHALRPAMARKVAVPLFLDLIRNPPRQHDPRDPERDDRYWQEVLQRDLATGLSGHATPAIANELIDLVLDTSLHWEIRIPLIHPGLVKTKDPRVPGLLMDLLSDPDLAPVAALGLRRLRHAPARPLLEAALNSENQYLRQNARYALKQIP